MKVTVTYPDDPDRIEAVFDIQDDDELHDLIMDEALDATGGGEEAHIETARIMESLHNKASASLPNGIKYEVDSDG